MPGKGGEVSGRSDVFDRNVDAVNPAVRIWAGCVSRRLAWLYNGPATKPALYNLGPGKGGVMRYAEVRKDVHFVPPEFRQFFGGKELVGRDELLSVFRPIVRARRRGHYDASRQVLVTIEPRQVLSIPEEFVRYLGD